MVTLKIEEKCIESNLVLQYNCSHSHQFVIILRYKRNTIYSTSLPLSLRSQCSLSLIFCLNFCEKLHSIYCNKLQVRYFLFWFYCSFSTQSGHKFAEMNIFTSNSSAHMGNRIKYMTFFTHVLNQQNSDLKKLKFMTQFLNRLLFQTYFNVILL